MTVQLAIIMNPIESLSLKKDSSIALLQEASLRGWQLTYLRQSDLFCKQGEIHARTQRLTVLDHGIPKNQSWYALDEPILQSLHTFDLLLMRQDPPFNLAYVTTTYLLDRLVETGVSVVNSPDLLRSLNEKCSIFKFPDCCPAFLVSQDKAIVLDFIREQNEVVLKPLDSMGGQGILRTHAKDENRETMIDLLTEQGQKAIMVQRYLHEIQSGDKRIILVDGEPIPFALVRVPKPGDFRGNLARGATPLVRPLSERDHWIAMQVGRYLREEGLLFAGIDVIGDCLTEINITSPTGLRELEAAQPLGIARLILDKITAHLPV